MKALQGINAAARIGIELGELEQQLDSEISTFVDAVVAYAAELGDNGTIDVDDEDFELRVGLASHLGLGDFAIENSVLCHQRLTALRTELAATAH